MMAKLWTLCETCNGTGLVEKIGKAHLVDCDSCKGTRYVEATPNQIAEAFLELPVDSVTIPLDDVSVVTTAIMAEER